MSFVRLWDKLRSVSTSVQTYNRLASKHKILHARFLLFLLQIVVLPFRDPAVCFIFWKVFRVALWITSDASCYSYSLMCWSSCFSWQCWRTWRLVTILQLEAAVTLKLTIHFINAKLENARRFSSFPSCNFMCWNLGLEMNLHLILGNRI
jgi:hypothetical protein